MVCYSFLHARQGKLFSEIDRCAGKLIEQLKSRDFVAFNVAGAYPTTVPGDKKVKATTTTKSA
jgi:hypothetical protein